MHIAQFHVIYNKYIIIYDMVYIHGGVYIYIYIYIMEGCKTILGLHPSTFSHIYIYIYIYIPLHSLYVCPNLCYQHIFIYIYIYIMEGCKQFGTIVYVPPLSLKCILDCKLFSFIIYYSVSTDIHTDRQTNRQTYR